ncbi:MAG TPA: ABC transporter permease [Planctomycetaceae bacterium]|nr:ABC transporter permease [Planctomycetaceae bacterium]
MTTRQALVEPANVKLVRTDESGEVASAEPVIAQIMITPHRGWHLINFAELWRFRELLYFLTWRDVKIRYKQTLLGAAWAVLQPFMMMIVFTVFLGRMAHVSSGEFPYPVFAYAGLLPWMFFSTAIANAGQSVVGSERLITKIYFPRLAIPMSSVGAALVDFLIAFVVLLGMMLWYRIVPSWNLLMVPVLLALLTLAAVGVGTLLAALNVAYRDFRYVIPFLAQLWMFATPTVYMATADESSPASSQQIAAVDAENSADPQAAAHSRKSADEGAVPDDIQKLLNLNPLTGLIGGFRAATLGGEIGWKQLGYSTVGVVGLFLAGCLYFRRVEDSFADII